MERIILHIDMDAFFASVEQRDHEKKDRLYDAIDKLKSRFGESVLTRGSLTKPKEES